MKVKTWTDDKDEFMLQMHDGEWVVTENTELLHDDQLDNLKRDVKVKESFFIVDRAGHHTTDWLRMYCEEHHPEVDFDEEFETNEPGAFTRYQDKFGYDYAEWVKQEIYNRLKEELAQKGYELPWE